MSERPKSDPEKSQIQPIFDDCSRCEERYQITPNNSVGYDYAKQPECSFLLCICPNCQEKTRIFVGQETILEARRQNIPILDDDYAHEIVYSEWLDLKGYKAPETYELTSRHEKIIAGFSHALQLMPDDILWDGFESEHDRPYPERWI